MKAVQATPIELAQALAASPEAADAFAKLSPACQREYLDWIGSAKKPETRQRRATESVSMLLRGRKRS